ncbi:bifunctional dTDP-4-dehydrorhamnose 3,5-epimerase/dTDP-4-dehydrorhamnose reductase-like [Humulus lupulus]|uniref:bifunctional dTDP-4-dehydrorhamnose 3,5-epimerase/dTDP-4-dehydrorhamnose reductase-like n=1 Tax=Humulus lupulus TaxID=3486 RepID=UPI002B416B6E|nr:bifunctional dTDP-4-dehydrorhamnose 3,5-epimerase/dTDP-4-dehydrorhamnose reductase-like [Humulus lupulus]
MGFLAMDGQDKPIKFLIYGRTGWIGGLLSKICKEQGINFEYDSGRLEDRASIEADIGAVKPTHVLNAVGVTGRPNVDWCESHKVETIRTNVVGTLNLADITRERGLLLLNYATGCIFEYDSAHPLGSGIRFKEEDKPNFIGSFYSNTKAMVSIVTYQIFIIFCFNLLLNYSHVLDLGLFFWIYAIISNFGLNLCFLIVMCLIS